MAVEVEAVATGQVLVVEDEPEIACLMLDFPEADGFRVWLAANGEEAPGSTR